MRVVVADTGPINYLVQINAVGVLPSLFGQVAIPASVERELLHPRTPAAVRDWIERRPVWLDIRPDPPPKAHASLPLSLDEGERAAIALARAIVADLILMDDREGVAFARQLGFAVTGTLGILDLAARRGLIDLAEAFRRLTATTFHYRQGLLDLLLRRHTDETK